jgi:hypothetical protein
MAGVDSLSEQSATILVESATILVEHFLIMRGVTSTELVGTRDIAEEIISADSVNEVCDIMDRALKSYPHADADETHDDAKLIFWAVDRLRG